MPDDGWKECATCGFTPEPVIGGFCSTCRADMRREKEQRSIPSPAPDPRIQSGGGDT